MLAISCLWAAQAGAGVRDAYAGAVKVAPDGRHLYFPAQSTVDVVNRDATTGGLASRRWRGAGKRTLELSPDGRSVYVMSVQAPQEIGATLNAFRRDPDTGTLTPQAISGWYPHSGFVYDIAVSPDGLNVYATESLGSFEGSGAGVGIFDRDPSTGALTYRSKLTNIDELTEARALAMSPDGHWLYVTGSYGDGPKNGIWPRAVATLERRTDGSLKPTDAKSCGCGTETLVLDPTGDRLYAGAMNLTTFERDPATGALGAPSNPLYLMSAGGDEPGGAGMAIAPGGDLYVVDTWDFRLIHLRRTASGLEVVRSYREGEDGIHGITNARSVAVSPDAKFVYVASGFGAVAIFSREHASGVLAFVSMFGDPNPLNPWPDPVGGSDGDQSGSGGPRWAQAARVDRSRPVIVSARLTAVPANGRRARASGPSRSLLTIRARDEGSGVRRVQVARRRSHPGRKRRFRRRLAVRGAPGRVWVRVLDGAGNRSRWRRVKRSR
jgi:DNA-binding beta-propeller fold protein YncE